MSKRVRVFRKMVILSGLLLVGTLGLYTAFSGDLEPAATPGPTMYTLEEIHNYKVWRMLGKTFVDHPGNNRFAIHDPATPGDNSDDLVLDKETGLIWARKAGSALEGMDTAAQGCRNLELGKRKGWRLPSVEELSSLIDMSVAGSPKLPTGHPFVSVQTGAGEYYWTDPTTSAAYMYIEYGLDLYGVNMGNGDVDIYPNLGVGDLYTWPVWGGKSVGY